MKKQKAIVIGAGIGGIGIANMLAKAGYDVTIYEKNSRPGGRTDIYEYDGFRFDAGASWYLMPKVFEHYFSLFGRSVSGELELVRLSPAYKVFFERHDPVVVSGSLEADAELFESIEPGAGKALRRYVKKSDEIYQLSLKHFLYTNFERFGDLLKAEIVASGPAMARLALTPIDAYVKGYVSDQRLRQILEYSMVFLGSSPFSAPALYSLMSALDFKEGVFYPKGGLTKVIDLMVRIGQEQGVKFVYDAPVKRIMTDGGKAVGIELSDGTEVSANIVISNADLHFTETKLLAMHDQTYPQSYWDKKEAGPSALLLYLGIKGELPSLEHHNLFFVDNWQDNFRAIFKDKTIPDPASIYICRPSATDGSVAPKGHENIFVLVPLPAGIELAPDEAERLADHYIAQIEQNTGISDLSARIVSRHVFGPDDFKDKYNAWQSTALGPSHLLSQSAWFRTPNVSKKVKNLYYVGGSTTPGIGLPMCLISAELVYKRIIGDTRGGAITSIRSPEEQHDA